MIMAWLFSSKNTLSHQTVAAYVFAGMELGRENSRGKVMGLTTKHWYLYVFEYKQYSKATL